MNKNAMSTKASLDLVSADWQKVDIGIVACFLPAKLVEKSYMSGMVDAARHAGIKNKQGDRELRQISCLNLFSHYCRGLLKTFVIIMGFFTVPIAS